MRGWILGGLALVGFLATGDRASAQYQPYQLSRFFYYPYVYYPHNYWPAIGPRWPEPPGAPYQPAPAYQANPPFFQSGYRYEMLQPQKYYRGFHFWLDQF